MATRSALYKKAKGLGWTVCWNRSCKSELLLFISRTEANSGNVEEKKMINNDFKMRASNTHRDRAIENKNNIEENIRKAKKARKLERQKIKKKLKVIQQVIKDLCPPEMKVLKRDLQNNTGLIKQFILKRQERYISMECLLLDLKKNVNPSLWNDNLTICLKECWKHAGLTLSAITDRIMEIEGVAALKGKLKKENKKKENKFYHGPRLHVSTLAVHVSMKYKDQFKSIVLSTEDDNNTIKITIDDFYIFNVNTNTTLKRLETGIKSLLGGAKCNICCNNSKNHCFCRYCDKSCCIDCYEKIIRDGKGVSQCPYCRQKDGTVVESKELLESIIRSITENVRNQAIDNNSVIKNLRHNKHTPNVVYENQNGDCPFCGKGPGSCHCGANDPC